MNLLDEILPKLKPYVLGWIGDIQSEETVGSHELSGSLHTGVLADSQATQFLKLDGSRQLIGNLSVTDAITIDGVDISAHAASADAHHARSHTIVSTSDHTASGLTAGWVLRASGASTFAWAQLAHSDLGTVTANQHHNQVHTITGADHTVTGSAYDLVGLSATNTLGVLTPSYSPLGTAKILRTDTSGYLTLVKAITTTLDTVDLQADYVDSNLIPKTTDTYTLGDSTHLWLKGWLSEMEAVLFAENTITLLGGWFWVPHDAGTLQSNPGPTDTWIDFGKTMTANDFVVLRSSLQVEYIKVVALVSGTTYSVNRNLDGSGANTWPSGTPFAVLGNDGDGRIELNAYNTPRIQLIKQGTTYNAQTELIRIGDLNGNWDYPAETWGLAIGEYASTKPNIVIDETGYMRFRFYNVDVMTFYGGNADITGKLRMPGTSSAIAIGATPPTSATAGTGIWIDRTGFYSLLSGTYQVKIDTTTGKLYAGGGYITLGSNGIVLSENLASANAIDFYDATTKIGRINCYETTPDNHVIEIDGLEGLILGVGSFTYGDWTNAFILTVSSAALGSSLSVDGSVYISDSSNAFMTLGLTINQGANDDEILALKSSDVAHGVTDLAETDTFMQILKIDGATGGVNLRGYAESTTRAIQLSGIQGTPNTAKNTGAVGAVNLAAYKISGTSITNMGTDANLVVIRDSSTTRFIFDAEGSAHADVEWIAFDEYDDLALLSDLETAMIDPVKAEFGEFLKYNHDTLERAGIVHFDRENPGHAMLNTTRLSMLLVGALRQLGGRVGKLENLLTETT